MRMTGLGVLLYGIFAGFWLGLCYFVLAFWIVDSADYFRHKYLPAGIYSVMLAILLLFIGGVALLLRKKWGRVTSVVGVAIYLTNGLFLILVDRFVIGGKGFLSAMGSGGFLPASWGYRSPNLILLLLVVLLGAFVIRGLVSKEPSGQAAP